MVVNQSHRSPASNSPTNPEMKHFSLLLVFSALALPATLSAQDAQLRPAQRGATEAAPSEVSPGVAETCEFTVELSANAANDDGTLPLRGWTHVAVTHRRGAEVAPPSDAEVAEALRALDADGDGALSPEEIEGHVESSSRGASATLPRQCRPVQGR